MSSRSYLRNEITLCGKSNGAVFHRVFQIVKRISEGASVICYEAYHESSGHGILKEFYPQDAIGVERTKSGQLIPSPGFEEAYHGFERARAAYVEPYEMLLTAKRQDTTRDLATFIPPFEIYRGCDDAGLQAGSVYIWTPEPELYTFDKLCEKIHRHPGNKPEHNMVTVLCAIDALTKCICSLHKADLLHRDIKPSNFGFRMRGGDTLTQTLSMFDINTVCSVYGNLDAVVGTPGYLEPEAGYDIATNQTDIFAIGATLFHAIIVTDEAKANGYLYQSKYFDQLQSMVDNSRLIQASEANAHPRLRNILGKILTKCLCDRSHRYENCEQLSEDLNTALYYALPSEIAQKHQSGATWVLSDAEKSLDIHAEKNAALAIEQLLFAHPLYQYADGPEINILLIGFGNYGQKFLDTALQIGQMRGKKLNIMVISDDITDKQLYLSERPALPDFFSIDGSVPKSDASYGSVTFSVARLDRGNLSANSKILQSLTLAHYESSPLHYIFVALGEDLLNRSAASACRKVINVCNGKCSISCAQENQVSDPFPEGLIPVYVNSDITGTRYFSELERMAFNTHLVWEKNLNIDARAVKKDFNKPYNYHSCISSVLSLKYKLYSIGIDLDKLPCQQAAKQFHLTISDKKNQRVKNELIWIEHRRWVAEKLCLGWQGISDLRDCLYIGTKNEKSKRHVCILRSRPDQKLATEYQVNGSYDRWDTATAAELALLDDLDRMSVALHRVYRRKADALKQQNLLSGHNIAAIRSQITGDKDATVAFQEWFSCLKDIWNGNSEKVREYKGLKNALLSFTDKLAPEIRKSVADQVSAFERLFDPIRYSVEYRNWKQDDVAMIDNIPFILTYSENAHMVIPFVVSDNNTTVFSNIAAPAVVNPQKILYLVKAEDVAALKETLPYITEYMGKKNLKSKIEIILLFPQDAPFTVSAREEEEILAIGNKRVLRPVKHIVYDSLKTVSDYLEHRSQGKALFALEKNNTNLSGMLEGAGVYNHFAHYSFDTKTIQFYAVTGCEAFGYIQKPVFNTVADMIAFRLSSSESSNQPEFFLEYKDLWKIYTEKSAVWKSLCTILGEQAARQDILISIKKKPPREKLPTAVVYTYILPFGCCGSVSKILAFLKTHGVIEAESFVAGYTSDSCEVHIVDKCGYRSMYNQLFSNLYALMADDAVSISLNTHTHEITVCCDNLLVTGLQLSGARSVEQQSLLEYLHQAGYLINLRADSCNRFSFTYATRQIKALLTTAGKILEVYTYHKAKETGQFDDIVSSYEVAWQNTAVTNEFDCILTKGFRMLFVECKARIDIEQDFYNKLVPLVERFGINATAVLIADTQEKPFYDHAPVNAMQRKRGNLMNVVTVWKREEISNIGQILLKIMNGDYVSKEF